jgi:AraC family transcriptional regulator
MKKTTVLHIKNMVCPRCIKVVSEELKNLGFDVITIQLGKVELNNIVSVNNFKDIREVLNKNGFELLDDKKSKIIETIKVLIIEGIRGGTFTEMNINISQYLSNNIQMEYTQLSALFSSIEGKSIERYIILQKTERIKELITYNELSIKEISISLGYSSLQALSSQFKKETGLTPTEFKNQSYRFRKPIDEI